MRSEEDSIDCTDKVVRSKVVWPRVQGIFGCTSPGPHGLNRMKLPLNYSMHWGTVKIVKNILGIRLTSHKRMIFL